MSRAYTPFRRHAIREICAAGNRLLNAAGLETDIKALRSMRASPDELIATMAETVLGAFGDEPADDGRTSDVACATADVIPLTDALRPDGTLDFDAARTRQMLGKAALYPSNGDVA